MTGSAPGHKSRSEEPHCYNCGASGHWVIACPEPTRETPAGLSAWKNSANASHGHGRGKDQQHGGPKKAKGPIITKYAPPPPHPAAVGVPGTFYSLPPGAYYPTPGNPPGSVAYPPHYPPYSHPGPHPHPHPHPLPYPQSAPGYQPTAYTPPSSYPQQQFSPPVSYGAHQIAHPPYPASVPPRPPPVSTLPPRYPSYPPSRADTHSYGPLPPHLPPHPPSHPPPQPPPYTQPSTHRQPRPSYSPPPGRGPVHAHQPVPSSRSLPPPPSLPPSEGLHHSLPPKPPKAVRDIQDSYRGNRHKRKNDRQNRHRDSRTKESPSRRPPHALRQQSDHRGSRRTSQAPADAPSSLPRRIEKVESPSKTHSEALSSTSTSPKVDLEKTVQDVPQTQQPSQFDGVDEVVLDDLDDRDWESATIFKDPEPSNGLDEVGAPLPDTYTETLLPPRNWDAKCLISKYIKADNLEDFIKPIHETVAWLTFEFDPAFLRDGQFPNGEPLADYMEQITSFDFKYLGNASTDREEMSGQSPSANSLDNERIVTPSNENAASASNHTANSEIDGPAEREAQSPLTERDAEVPQTSPSLPRTRIRKRSRERRRSPQTSRDSRRSSVSSQSSDLSSLEAELLGRPPKRKRASDIPRRRRLESHPRQQPGRWPSVASSAYSRRW